MPSLKKRKAHATNRNALLKMHNVSVTKVVDTTIQLSVLSEAGKSLARKQEDTVADKADCTNKCIGSRCWEFTTMVRPITVNTVSISEHACIIVN